jgi:thioredoxin-like negative regulator of GroEL
MLAALLLLALAIALTTAAVLHVLWYIRPDQIDTTADFMRRINRDQPVIVEFFSNLWTICTVTKPVVDRLERDLRGRATVVRIDLFSKVGREAAYTYGIKLIPAFVVFDGHGKVILQQCGLIDATSIHKAITEQQKWTGPWARFLFYGEV